MDFPALRSRAHISARTARCGLLGERAEHGDVPVRRSVQDCATRGNIRRFIASANPSYSGSGMRSITLLARVARICKICVLSVKSILADSLPITFSCSITECRGLIIPWSEVNLLRDVSSTLFTYTIRFIRQNLNLTPYHFYEWQYHRKILVWMWCLWAVIKSGMGTMDSRAPICLRGTKCAGGCLCGKFWDSSIARGVDCRLSRRIPTL